MERQLAAGFWRLADCVRGKSNWRLATGHWLFVQEDNQVSWYVMKLWKIEKQVY
jgi:hypothetical protein